MIGVLLPKAIQNPQRIPEVALRHLIVPHAVFETAQCALDEAFTAPVEVFFPRSASSDNGDGRRYYFWEDAVQVGGWYFCRLNVADLDGRVSDWSNVATVRKVARPNPPELSETR